MKLNRILKGVVLICTTLFIASQCCYGFEVEGQTFTIIGEDECPLPGVENLVFPLVEVDAFSDNDVSESVTYDGDTFNILGCIQNSNIKISSVFLPNWLDYAQVGGSSLTDITISNIDWWLRRYNKKMRNGYTSYVSGNHMPISLYNERSPKPGYNDWVKTGYYKPLNLSVYDEQSDETMSCTTIKIPAKFNYFDLSRALDNFQNIEVLDLSEIDLTKTGFKCYGNIGLKNVIFNPRTTELPDGMFANCFYLKEMDLPNQITRIGKRAFAPYVSNLKYYIYSLTGSTTQTIDVPNNNVMMLEKIELPVALQSIDDCAFESTSIKQLTIGNNVTELGRFICYNCRQLESVQIGEGVTKVVEVFGSKYFTNDNYDYDHAETKEYTNLNVKMLKLGSRVNQIGEKEFSYMPRLEVVSCLNPIPPVCEGDEPPFLPATLASATLYVRRGCKAAYEADEKWGQFAEIQEFDFPDISPIAGFEQTSFILTPGQTAEIKMITDGDIESVKYDSSDASVAHVGDDDKIIAGQLGQSIINVIPNNRQDLAMQVVVNVVEPEKPFINNIVISGPTEMKTGEVIKLTATTLPDDSPYTEVIFKPRNTRLAFADLNGNIYAQRPGKVIVEAFSATNNEVVSPKHIITITGEPLVNLATGIDDIVDDEDSESEEVLYDLQGRRVSNPAPGLYIRVNGTKTSKVLITD